MTDYRFDLVPPEAKDPIEDNSPLANRPFIDKEHSLKEDALHYIAGDALADTINTAIAVGKPLLLTGEPGTFTDSAIPSEAHPALGRTGPFPCRPTVLSHQSSSLP